MTQFPGNALFKKNLTILCFLAAAGCASSPPISQAIIQGDSAKTSVLLSQASKSDLSKMDDEGGSPLVRAAQMGDVNLISALVSKGAKVNSVSKAGMTMGFSFPNFYFGFGFTPLLAAAEAGQTAAVKKLLELGSNPNEKSSFGWNALLLAAAYDQMDTVKLLQEKGLSLTTKQFVELDQLQRCDYRTGRADATEIKGASPETFIHYRALYCKEHCSAPQQLVKPIEGDKRPLRVTSNILGFCANAPTRTPYCDGFKIAMGERNIRESAVIQAVAGVAVAGAGAAATAALDGSNAHAIVQGLGGTAEALAPLADRKTANFAAPKSHAVGCPDWAPWLLKDSCYGTEKQACHGKSGCGAVNQ